MILSLWLSAARYCAFALGLFATLLVAKVGFRVFVGETFGVFLAISVALALSFRLGTAVGGTMLLVLVLAGRLCSLFRSGVGRSFSL